MLVHAEVLTIGAYCLAQEKREVSLPWNKVSIVYLALILRGVLADAEGYLALGAMGLGSSPDSGAWTTVGVKKVHAEVIEQLPCPPFC